MDISFSDFAGGSIVTELVSIAWLAIPLGLVAALARHRKRAKAVPSLDLGR